MFLKWLNKQIIRLTCLIKGCDGRTGTHADCIKCPGYDMNNSNCDIL
jgi:hypothetical protein